MQVKQSFLRHTQEDKNVDLQWVSTVDQLADILTKPLAYKAFQKLRDEIVFDVDAESLKEAFESTKH